MIVEVQPKTYDYGIAKIDQVFMLAQHLDFPFLWEQAIADVLKTLYVHTA